MISFCQGTRRNVIILGCLVFKIPRVRPFTFFKYFLGNLFDKEAVWRQFALKGWQRLLHEFIFEGFLENWREAVCYYRTRHKILAALYVPLLIINVYRREEGCGCSTIFKEFLVEQVLNDGHEPLANAMSKCGHTFSNPLNFSFSGGRLKMLDYGGEDDLPLIANHGDELLQVLEAYAQEEAP
jgi:hypothetical protein